MHCGVLNDFNPTENCVVPVNKQISVMIYVIILVLKSIYLNLIAYLKY